MDRGIDQDDLAKKLNQNDRNGLVSETPWHQDNAVFTEDVDDVDILTVWFPITSAPIEKGCLKVVPGSHKGGLRAHCPGSTSDLAIPDALMTDESLALPMAAGDVLFLHRKTCHGSLPNLTSSARFSFDLRFQPQGTPNGRDILPSFPLRSRQAPAAVLKDAGVWAETWREAREKLSKTDALPPMNRWSADSPDVCVRLHRKLATMGFTDIGPAGAYWLVGRIGLLPGLTLCQLLSLPDLQDFTLLSTLDCFP